MLHFTPTYSSWLNLVERFFALLTDEALRRGSHTSIPQLRQAIMNYVEAHNEEAGPFKWTKTADEVLESVRSPNDRDALKVGRRPRVRWEVSGKGFLIGSRRRCLPPGPRPEASAKRWAT